MSRRTGVTWFGRTTTIRTIDELSRRERRRAKRHLAPRRSAQRVAWLRQQRQAGAFEPVTVAAAVVVLGDHRSRSRRWASASAARRWISNRRCWSADSSRPPDETQAPTAPTVVVDSLADDAGRTPLRRPDRASVGGCNDSRDD